MPSFSQQIQDADAAHHAASALDAAARQQIALAFDQWDSGELNALTVRYRLESIVRSAYRSSATVAEQHAVSQAADLPGWKPERSTFNTPYLKELILDVRRNLREFKKSDRDDKARRRAVLRIQHSAGVGATRGYTDALINTYSELEGFGYDVRKVWVANFINNDPCDHCRDLHGVEVGLTEPFPSVTDSKVYVDLKGPPKHPRCHCKIVTLLVRAENAMETLDFGPPTPPAESLTSGQVRSLPFKIFSAIVKALIAVVKFVRG